MLIASATGEFIADLIRERVSADLYLLSRMMRYHICDADFDDIRKNITSDGEMTILTGLLSEKNVEVVQSRSLLCNSVGRLLTWPNTLLELAICYGRALFASTECTEVDRSIFVENMVDLLCQEQDMTAWIVQRSRQGRILAHWVLRDGGTQRPREILGRSFLTASELLVYDRFFRQHTLNSLRDALEFARDQRGGMLQCNITICVGDPGDPGHDQYLDYSTVVGVLQPYIDRGNRICLETVVRGRPRGSWLHDRFIQVDRSSTFVFTVGVGCFFEGRHGAGPNRSCHIFEFAIGQEWEEFDFEVLDGRRRSRRVIRT